MQAKIEMAGDPTPGPGEGPAPERETSASSQAPLTAITPADQAVLDAADEWFYDLVRRGRPTSPGLRTLYDAVQARIPDSERTRRPRIKYAQ